MEKLEEGETPLSVPGVALQNWVPTGTPRVRLCGAALPRPAPGSAPAGLFLPGAGLCLSPWERGEVPACPSSGLASPCPGQRDPLEHPPRLCILRSLAGGTRCLGTSGFSSLTPGTDPGHTTSAGAPAGLCAALTAWRVSQRSGHLPVPWHRLSFVCLPARVGWETVSKAVSHRPRLSLSLGAGCYIVEGCRGGYVQFLLRKPADRSQTPPVPPGSPGLFSPSPSQGSR